MIGNLIAAATPVQRVVAVAVGAVVLGLLTLGVLGLGRGKTTTALPDTFHGMKVPPIDAVAPAKTETATFALG